jgi:hypothetical protein
MRWYNTHMGGIRVRGFIDLDVGTANIWTNMKDP